MFQLLVTLQLGGHSLLLLHAVLLVLRSSAVWRTLVTALPATAATPPWLTHPPAWLTEMLRGLLHAPGGSPATMWPQSHWSSPWEQPSSSHMLSSHSGLLSQLLWSLKNPLTQGQAINLCSTTPQTVLKILVFQTLCSQVFLPAPPVPQPSLTWTQQQTERCVLVPCMLYICHTVISGYATWYGLCNVTWSFIGRLIEP